jgi:hypothetical protein
LERWHGGRTLIEGTYEQCEAYLVGKGALSDYKHKVSPPGTSANLSPDGESPPVA